MTLEDATKQWAAAKAGVNPEFVTDVRFTTIQQGFCETCAYETCGVAVTLKGDRAGAYPGVEVDLDGVSMVEVIREIAAIVSSTYLPMPAEED